MSKNLQEVYNNRQLHLKEDINLPDDKEVNIEIFFLGDKDKALGSYKAKARVQSKKIKYPFKIIDLVKKIGIQIDDVVKVKAVVDINDDGIAQPSEETYLKVIENEEKITVIVELPHSKESGWGAKGLAGHTAMAIGDRFFDYGPDYDDSKIFDEKKYQADLNQDGDQNDKVTKNDIPGLGHFFAPGRPWWGELLANAMNIKAHEVTLQTALQLINLPYTDTNIYGTVYKIEFFVKKSQAKKMIQWWETRYKHLKVYSVKPWTGEQCTTTVKEALAFAGLTDIDWNTLTPDGILEDLKTEVKSTSKQHKDQPAKVVVIKKEAKNWQPPN